MVPLSEPQQIAPGLLVYLFSHSLYYANAGQFAEEVLRLAKRDAAAPGWLCVEAAAIGDVDFSAAAMLRDTCHTAQGAGNPAGVRQCFGRCASVRPLRHHRLLGAMRSTVRYMR
jgi:MFS superfamily sulfate permease-like transporter